MTQIRLLKIVGMLDHPGLFMLSRPDELVYHFKSEYVSSSISYYDYFYYHLHEVSATCEFMCADRK